MINRVLEKTISDRWNDRKVIVVIGPRQVGKTTLLKNICQQRGTFLYLNGDDYGVRELLEQATEQRLRQIIGNNTTLFIDEAQRIKNIGLTLKIIHDQIDHVRLLVSGSSALEIASEINEPLTGRKYEMNLWPISWKEWVQEIGFVQARADLENRLIYGMYPEVLNNRGGEIEVLKELASSNMYKDLLNHQGVRNPLLLEKILRALAFQIGNEISYNEIAQLVTSDRGTVESYIRLLEQCFVIFSLPALSRNMRNEIKQGRKIYFYDNGIRNAFAANFNPIQNRNDIGALWENFIISERLKHRSYQRAYGYTYFWRTYQQQEIDYIEEADGVMNAFEMKWNPHRKAKLPSNFKEAYPNHEFNIIHPDNFEEYLM